MKSYRPDIDGLRTIAVMPVVLFHADVSGVSGGYVGVDVFFVISGFLITSIIHREVERGDFSILRFYERRARRILPALIAVVVATLIAAFFLFMPREFEQTAKSAAAAMLFVSNLLFYSDTGYFSPGIYERPLLHTWSLAIEEQFYIFFPPLMMLLAALGRRPGVIIAVLTLISVALSAFTTASKPDMAYYLLPWRAWELGIGALIALWMPRISASRPLREVLGLAGLAMILLAVVTFDEATVFPGYAALLPCVGAGLVIAFGGHGDTMFEKFLSLPVMVFIGLISYSLYLWHWPVIVFYQQFTLDRPDPVGCVLVVGLSIFLAWLSWAYIEAPFRGSRVPGARKHRPISRRAIFSGSATGMVAVSFVAAMIVAGHGWDWRLPKETVRLAAFELDKHPKLRECTGRFEEWRAPDDPCVFGTPGQIPTVMIWGDSHAAALLPEIEAAAKRTGSNIGYLSRAGCLPVTDTERADGRNGGCEEYGDGAMAFLLNTPEVDTVFIVARYALAAKGYLSDYGLAERDWPPTRYSDAQTGAWPEADRLSKLLHKIEETVSALRSNGKRVALIYPIPEMGYRVPETLAKLALQHRELKDFGVDRALYDARNENIIKGLNDIAERHGAIPIRSDEILCDAVLCRASRNGEPLYHDDDHLSSVGARLFGESIDKIIETGKTASAAPATRNAMP